MSAAGCTDMEPLLAARALGELTTLDERRLATHLGDCAGCRALAGELDGGAVGQALLDAGVVDDMDFAELGVVARENYVRGEEIGRGGMGRVVRARDRRLGRGVVLKELLDDRLRARFELEARLTARLMHPAIVNVLEAGRWPGGAPFYAMKHVAGEPLDRAIAARRTLAERMALLPNLITVVDAVAYAHHERVIHRDLKPANILVGPFGETVVIDWGLAKDLAAADAAEPSAPPYRDRAELTVGAAGTPNYMPPEQAEGRGSDPRVDVYALGATLYHLLAGKPPYGTVGARRVMQRLREAAPPPVGEVEPGVAPALAAIVAKAMARDPAARYASARDLADELKRFQNGQLVAAHHYTLRERAARVWSRHRALVSLALASLVALASVGGVALAQVVAARRDAERQLAALLLERASHELAEGHPTRALPYVTAALERGADGPGVRTLLAEAGRPLAGLERSVALAAGPARAASISPDGTRVASASYDGTVALWSLPGGERLATLPRGAASDVLLFSPDGATLVTGGRCLLREEPCDHTLWVWDARSGTARAAVPHAAPLEDVGFEGDDTLVVVSDLRRTFSLTTGVSTSYPASPRAALHTRVTTRDGRRTAILHLDGRAELTGGPTDRLVATRAVGIRLSPDESTLLTVQRDGAVRAFDVVTGLPTAVWDATATPPLDAQLAGDRLVTVDGELVVRAYRADGARLVAATVPDGLAERPPRLIVAVRSTAPTSVAISEAATGKVLRELPIRYTPLLARRELVLSDDERLLAVLASERRATLYDVASGEERAAVLESGTIELLAFNRDGRRFFTAGADIGATVWTVDGRRVSRLPLPFGALTSAAWSPDGTRIVVGARDGQVVVYDVATGLRVAAHAAFLDPVDRVAWSADGARVEATCGRRVTSWDARPDGRSPAGAALLAAQAPLLLENGHLVARPRPEREVARPAVARVAVPAGDAEERMRRHFERGQDLYRLMQYEDAAAEFLRAHDARPASSLLYNAAVCFEKLRRYPEAVALFRRYLDASPSTRDRAAVEARIAALLR